MSQPLVEFYYDIRSTISGYAPVTSTYADPLPAVRLLGSRPFGSPCLIEALASRTNARIIWRPVLLGAIYRATDAPQGAAGSASDVFNPTKKAVSSKAFRRTISRLGIVHNEPRVHPQKTTAALRLLYFVDEESRAALSHTLFQAYWVDGKTVGTKETLIDAVRRSGIPRQDEVVEAVNAGTFEGTQERLQLEKATDIAVQRGTPGVPAFWIPHEQWTDPEGRKRTGRMYWGQDRMQFVEAILLANGIENALATIPKLLRDLEYRCARHGIPHYEEVKLEFWYDFSSPWAFLGWTQLARLQRQFGERLQIEMKPFLLGILFRQIGAPNLPMSAISEQKKRYSRWDHRDWVRWHNAVNHQEGRPDENIDFVWNSIFPIRTPTVLRTVLVEPELVGPLFRACWEQDLDMANDAVLKNVIDKAGYDGLKVLEQANGPAAKAELRARTQEAISAGICGVPSYRVFRRRDGAEWKQAGSTVWGQDLIGDVEDLIAGWDERASKLAGKL